MRILEVNPAGALCVLDLDDCHILAAACDMARGSTCAADRRAALGGLAAAFDVAVLLLDVEEENPADFPVEPTPPAAATLLGVMGALRAQADRSGVEDPFDQLGRCGDAFLTLTAR